MAWHPASLLRELQLRSARTRRSPSQYSRAHAMSAVRVSQSPCSSLRFVEARRAHCLGRNLSTNLPRSEDRHFGISLSMMSPPESSRTTFTHEASPESSSSTRRRRLPSHSGLIFNENRKPASWSQLRSWPSAALPQCSLEKATPFRKT